MADEQVAVEPVTTSVAVQGAVQPGTAIVVTVLTPQTKAFGKSIPANPAARQALKINPYSVESGWQTSWPCRFMKLTSLILILNPSLSHDASKIVLPVTGQAILASEKKYYCFKIGSTINSDPDGWADTTSQVLLENCT